MGQEVSCTVRFGRRSSAGRALLESSELVFIGDFRLSIPFQEIAKLDARNGRLVVAFPRGTASFDLGDRAARWAEKIRQPRGLIDKLGVKPGARVAVLGVADPAFAGELAGRTDDIATARPKKDSDLIFLGAASGSDLRRLPALRASLKPAGALWVVWPKGRPEFREDDVRRAALGAGLVDVKVVAFSAALSALKLVIPVAQRGRAGRGA